MEMLPIMSPEQAAPWLGCEPRTVQEDCRSGLLPAVKFGVDWVIPAAALLQRVNELAIEESKVRRTPAQPAAVKVPRSRRTPPDLG